ncbi:MAG: hypothetical protein SFU53_09810 [Terrimicrobiaceae bacterium]|nr:hypothetical protein [Terrimicrobiaceae bacterium]
MRRIVAVLCLILLSAPAGLLAGEKKAPPVTIRLHGEGNEREGESFVSEVELTNPPKKIFIRKVPVINERDVKAFLSFPGRDGSFGAYFRLDAHGANKLQQFTTEERGDIAVIMINGRVAAAVMVDRPVKDGLLFVPAGITAAEVAQLAQKYPEIGRESEFRKKPKTKKPEA